MYTFFRNGVVDNVYAKYLVPGDIVYLSVGDRIPADVRLVRVNELAVDESSFTGETEPKYKSTELRPEVAAGKGRCLCDARKIFMCYVGTLD